MQLSLIPTLDDTLRQLPAIVAVDEAMAPPPGSGLPWSDAATERLHRLFKRKGQRASVVASALGTTRNAVLGRAHRTGGTREPGKQRALEAGPKRTLPSLRPMGGDDEARDGGLCLADLAARYGLSEQCGIDEAPATGCAFIGDDGHACGDETAHRSPYCEHHHAVTHARRKKTAA